MALRNSDPLPRANAWGAVIFSSALPTIIWHESGHARSFWLALIQCAVLIIAAIGVLPFPRLRVLTRFLLALAVLRLGWYVVAPWLERLVGARVTYAPPCMRAAGRSFGTDIPRPVS